MSTKRKKVTVTIEQKLQALLRIDAGETLTRIATDLGVGKQTVCDWKRNRKEIEEFCSKMITKDSLGNRSTMKKPKNEKLDRALYIWYCQNHEQSVPMSSLKLQAIALKLNEELGGDPAFTASKGWLHRWKERHGLRELGVSVEIPF
nr:unnamed protein product [Callosobruchus analis]